MREVFLKSSKKKRVIKEHLEKMISTKAEEIVKFLKLQERIFFFFNLKLFFFINLRQREHEQRRQEREKQTPC